MANILTTAEVKKAIFVDADFSDVEAERLAKLASSYLKEKTGFDFAAEETKEPLAIQCAILYIRAQYFMGEGYNRQYDYGLGLSSIVLDLQGIAKAKEDEDETEEET